MYTITIVESKVEEKIILNEWKVIGQINKKPDFGGEPYLADEYGYLPPFKKEVESTRQIYQQTMKEIDMSAVIEAVNGLA